MDTHVIRPLSRLERTDSSSSIGSGRIHSPKPVLVKKFSFATIAKQALEKKKTVERYILFLVVVSLLISLHEEFDLNKTRM